MKIACLIHSLDGGGAERVMAGLSSRLALRGHPTNLITLDNGQRDRHEVAGAVERTHLNLMRESRGKVSALLNIRRRVRGIRDALRDWQPDVLLSFCDRTNVLAGLACRSATRTGDLPAVLGERSDPFEQTLPWAWRLLRRQSYPAAQAIVVQTDRAAQYFYHPRFPRSVVIPSAVEAPTHRRGTAAVGNQRFVAVGRLSPEKGFDRLVDAFALISDQYPQWSLRILGDGPLRAQLVEQTVALGIADRVGLPGWSTEVEKELADATVFVLPSRYEGFPSALLEAMAVGVPSIALSDQAGSAAILSHEFDGLLVPPDNLAAAMRRMIDDSQNREKWGRAATGVIGRFGWEVMVDAYEELLRSVAIGQS